MCVLRAQSYGLLRSGSKRKMCYMLLTLTLLGLVQAPNSHKFLADGGGDAGCLQSRAGPGEKDSGRQRTNFSYDAK